MTEQQQEQSRPSFDGYLMIDPRSAERFARADFVRTAGMNDCDPEDLPYDRVGSVGVVEIMGPLLQYGGWWWDGHAAIKQRCLAALADPAVTRLALRIDSPGGMAAGCLDAVRAVRDAAAAAGKPIEAWCGGNGAFSAAYAWACAGRRICLPDTGGAGSVGVLSVLCDETGANKLAGLKVVVVRSGARKADGHPDIPLDEGVIAREQAVIDGMAVIFAGEVVGPARGMTGEAVLALEGESFYGQTAVEKGIADEVMTWDQFLARSEAAGKEDTMKGVAGRLGLAESAGEHQVLEAINALEQRATTAERAAEGERKAHLALIVANGIRDRKITKAEGDQLSAAATGMANGSSWLAGLLASKESSALPAESHEPADKPRRSGPSQEGQGFDIKGKSEGELAAAFEAMGSAGQLELSMRDMATFEVMQTAWRKSKGLAAR